MQIAIHFRDSHVFLRDSPCFGPLVKSQHNLEISIKMARVSDYLSVSCDYGLSKGFTFYGKIRIMESSYKS